MQVPGGFKYYIPQVPKWKPNPWASFDSIVDGVLQVRNGNPFLAAKHGWSLNRQDVEDEVDAFNAQICAQMGWTNYISGGDGGAILPKPNAPLQEKQLSAVASKISRIWSGAKTLNGWLDSGEAAVPQAQADARARTCVACPQNGKGDLTSWFTVPAAAMIKRQFEKLSERKLSTPSDDQLGVCEACLCPIKLKVQTPIKWIALQLKPDVKADLAKGNDCWVLKELP